ncbi:hypothetical protein M2372_002820 [Chryseobacterium sp. BIGb0232]|nr:hypothetical protein [Chryseobacterium sp. BIGb0232]ROS11359.1 hypothetical protein EDF65_3766 [Chryseobacterium nakagawai]
MTVLGNAVRILKIPSILLFQAASKLEFTDY